MALLGNYSVLHKLPVKFIGGTTLSGDRAAFNKSGAIHNSCLGEGGFSHYNAQPNGYTHPYCWCMSDHAGGMAAYQNIVGLGSISSANLASGLGAFATITASGAISSADLRGLAAIIATVQGSGVITSADLGALIGSIVYGVATIAGGGSISAADLHGAGNIVAAMSGVGTLSQATIQALGNINALLLSAATQTADLRAHGEMSCTVSPFTTLSPESLAQKVWQSVAALYNDPGSMGALLHGAGAAGDPWTAELPGTYADGTAGAILGVVEAILRGKTITDPATGTMTVYAADGITPLLTANLFQDAAGATPYAGAGAERRERLE